jgi:hypothetical protein
MLFMTRGLLILVISLLLGCVAARPGEPPSADAGGSAKESAERLALVFRDYVYASYEISLHRLDGGESQDAAQRPRGGARGPDSGSDSGSALDPGSESTPGVARDPAHVERLRRARALLVEALTAAGLDDVAEGGGLLTLARRLTAYFTVTSHLRFLPSGAGDGHGVALVRVADQREVPGRDLAGRQVAYRVVVFSEFVIEDLDRYRMRLDGEISLQPVAHSNGRTIYLDRHMARRMAQERVISEFARVAALAGRASAGGGEALSAAEVKDVLRQRSLAEAVAAGGAVAAGEAILKAEELRLAALLAAAGSQALFELRDPEELARVVEEAVLRAAVVGDPRYQLASAIALTLVAPGHPTAIGAARALDAVVQRASRYVAEVGAGLPFLLRCAPEGQRRAARAALADLERE